MLKELFLVLLLTAAASRSVKYHLKWTVVGGLSLLFIITLIKFPLYEVVNSLRDWVAIDCLRFLLIVLRVYLLILIYMRRVSIFNTSFYRVKYGVVMLILLLVLWVSFTRNNYLLFYFMFESRLFPTLYIIVGWGYQPERLQAGVYFIIYTLFVSLPLFIVIIYLRERRLGARMWDILYLGFIGDIGGVKDYVIIVVLVIAFLVKLPIYLMHLWLPRAHVEAPVAGSMILAGVLLKLGGYGLFRLSIKFNFVISLSIVLIRLRLTGMIYIGVTCCRLNDLKSLVAYSSVVHMGLVICGVFRGSLCGLLGAVILIVRHGLSSSGLFCFVNILYERSGRRRMYVNKGVLTLAPIFSFFIFMLCCSNFSAPPRINFLSEIFF